MAQSPASPSGQVDTVMVESRVFPLSTEFVSAAKINSMAQYEKMCADARANPDKFWGGLAKEKLHWFKPFTKVLDWQAPFAKWFVGGQTNASYNCLDAHLTTDR